LECTPKTKRVKLPDDYYHLLDTNKKRFELDTSVGDEPVKGGGGRSNTKYIENRLKERNFKNFKGFTDTNDEFITGVKEMLAQGTMAKKTAQRIKKELEKTIDPLQILHILEKNIRFIGVEGVQNAKKPQKREVILSGYVTK